jgi:hypothetical protein
VINDNFIICNEKKYPIKRNQKTGSGNMNKIRRILILAIIPVMVITLKPSKAGPSKFLSVNST